MAGESSSNFGLHYRNLCLKSKVCPLKSVVKYLNGTEFCLPVEAIRKEHWPFLLLALSADNSLTEIHFRSDHRSSAQDDLRRSKKRRYNQCFPTPYACTTVNISDICKCLANLLGISEVLRVLKIANVHLKREDALYLKEGLKNSKIVQFSLSDCHLQDDAVDIICQGLQSSRVTWVDFSSCGLSASGLTPICKLMKAHNIRRGSELFPQTLRNQLPVLDKLKGLRRISLNNNQLGNEGIGILVEALSEDMWIQALDLQKCSILNEGAKSILKIARSNDCLELIDLRLNNIDQSIEIRIALQLGLNNANKGVMHIPGDLWQRERTLKIVPKYVSSSVKMKVLKKNLSPKVRGTRKKPESLHKAFRIPCEKSIPTSSLEDASSQTTYEFNREINVMRASLSKEKEFRMHLTKTLKQDTLF